MKHEHPPVRSRYMKGGLILGMFQAVVNGGQSAKSRLTWDRQMSEADRKEDLKRIRDARRAKTQMEEILELNGFYGEQNGPKLREIRNQSFDEMLKGEVQVEIFYSETYPPCGGVVEKIREICQPQGFKVRLTPIEESPPGKEWVLESWPHIEVGGREVTPEMLEYLAVDVAWVRARGSRREVSET